MKRILSFVLVVFFVVAPICWMTAQEDLTGTWYTTSWFNRSEGRIGIFITRIVLMENGEGKICPASMDPDTGKMILDFSKQFTNEFSWFSEEGFLVFVYPFDVNPDILRYFLVDGRLILDGEIYSREATLPDISKKFRPADSLSFVQSQASDVLAGTWYKKFYTNYDFSNFYNFGLKTHSLHDSGLKAYQSEVTFKKDGTVECFGVNHAGDAGHWFVQSDVFYVQDAPMKGASEPDDMAYPIHVVDDCMILNGLFSEDGYYSRSPVAFTAYISGAPMFNIHQNPDESSPVIGRAYGGQYVLVLGRMGESVNIFLRTYDGKVIKGYVFGAQFELSRCFASFREGVFAIHEPAVPIDRDMIPKMYNGVKIRVLFLNGAFWRNGKMEYSNCGQTSAIMLESYLKGTIPEKNRIIEINKQFGTNPEKDDGTGKFGKLTKVETIKDILVAGMGFSDVSIYTLSKSSDLDAHFCLIKEQLAAGKPVITQVNARYTEERGVNDNYHALKPGGHMILLTGYDDEEKRIYFNDPGTSTGARATWTYDIFLNKGWSSTYDYPFVVVNDAKQE